MRGVTYLYLSIMMGIMCMFSISVPVFSFEWPIEDPRVISSFGTPEGNNYKKGIEIVSSAEGISPIEGGEVIFHSREYKRGIHDIPSPLGNSLVLQHERGIRSVYGHLSEPVEGNIEYFSLTEEFGKVGSSGISDGEYLSLLIIDSEVNRFVNPLLSLPSLADTYEPQLNSVTLQGDEKAFDLENENTVPQGKYRFLIDTFDLASAMDSLHPIAPYSIKVYINGEEQISLGFESITIDDWTAVPTNPLSVEASLLYSGEWEYNLGQVTLQTGEAVIEVSVNDFAGNESTATYRLQVLSR